MMRVNRRQRLTDGARFSLALGRVLGRKPVEAEVGIVDPLLLGIEQNEAVLVCQTGPARALVVSSCGLGAAMEDDNERRSALRAGRLVSPSDE